VRKFEKELGMPLPPAYRAFLLRCNGGRPDPDFFPIRGLENNPFGGLHYFWGLDLEIESCNLDWTYRTYRGRMPSNLLAIAGTGMGDEICLSLRGVDKDTVYSGTTTPNIGRRPTTMSILSRRRSRHSSRASTSATSARKSRRSYGAAR